MSTELATIKTSLPANLAALFGGDDEKDLSGGVGLGFPIMSIKGKVWTITRGKTREIIRNADGDARSSIEVVIIKGNKNLSKVYYEGGYKEGSVDKPTCYSNDAITPAADAVSKQSAKCATCKHNQWGSRIGDAGQKGKACGDARRIAIAPAGLLNDPMLLRVPAASLKPLMEYNDDLLKRGAKYNLVITKMGFKAEAPAPTLTFKAIGPVSEAQAIQIAETMHSDTVIKILGEGTGLTAEPESGGTATFADPSPVAAAPKPAKPTAPIKEDDDLAAALRGVLGDPADD